MTKHLYDITVRFLDGRIRGYSVRMTAEKQYRHELALHKMSGVRSVACVRVAAGLEAE
jgi:hypothetical protein